MKSGPREIIYYEDSKGAFPAHQWLEKLKDKKTRVIIKGRIRRMEEGNFGHTRPVGDGLIELKIDFGPGFRVYLGFDGEKIVVILAAGDKSAQSLKTSRVPRSGGRITRREKYEKENRL